MTHASPARDLAHRQRAQSFLVDELHAGAQNPLAKCVLVAFRLVLLLRFGDHGIRIPQIVP